MTHIQSVFEQNKSKITCTVHQSGTHSHLLNLPLALTHTNTQSHNGAFRHLLTRPKSPFLDSHTPFRPSPQQHGTS